jgi:hypothetical protein
MALAVNHGFEGKFADEKCLIVGTKVVPFTLHGGHMCTGKIKTFHC